MRRWISRLADVFFRRAREERLDQEVRAHLDLLTDDFIARGMSPGDARLAARKAFGGVDQIKERYRDERGFWPIDDLVHDLRLAVRLLAREPGFVMAAACSLAIGIGATTTVFTVANGLLLGPPPGVSDRASLIDISRHTDGEGFGIHEMSFPNVLDLRERATTAEICAYEPIAEAVSLIADSIGGAERVFGNRVTPNYFSVHGVTPIAGRFFDDHDGDAAVVLSHRFWTRRFGSDPSIIGNTVRINGSALVVVGVAAERFQGTSLVATDLWVAMSWSPPASSYQWQRGLFWAVARGRVKQDVTFAQAAAEIETIGRALEREHPDTNSGTRFRTAAVSSIPGDLATPLTGVLALILAFVSLVLVVACSNLASLLLARGAVRQREVAVRLALGSSRGRLVRQLLTETLLLFAIGEGLGLVVARAATAALLSVLPALPLPLQVDLPIDVRVAAFATVLSLLTALAAGIMPALESTRSDVSTTLKNHGVGTSSRSRVRHAFVVAQIACGVVLIVGAALFTRAVATAVAVDRGFDPSGIQLADIDLSLAAQPAGTTAMFLQTVTDALRANPSITAAAVAANAPDRGRLQLGSISVPAGSRSPRAADWNAIQPGYFHTVGVPLQSGRDFDASDDAAGRPVAIVNEEAARRLWPGQDPIGKSLLHQPNVVRRGVAPHAVERIIVGVAADLRDAAGNARVQVYVPLAQHDVRRLTILVRAGNTELAAEALRRAIVAADPAVPIVSMQTLESALSVNALPRRLAASISTGLALVSLLLAAAGVYGISAYAAARQTKEIGIRMSLGATAPAIRRLIATAGLRLVAIGFVIGSIAAIGAARILQTSLAGFPSLDPIAFIGGLAIFSAAVVTASWVPARRASRIDPMMSLRQE